MTNADQRPPDSSRESELRTITRLSYQKKNKERVNVYLDGEYAFAVTETVAAGLRRGQQLSPAEIEQFKADDLRNKAYSLAVRYLGYRPRSRREVEQHLQRKQYTAEDVEFVITKLEERRYLDDRTFAQFWIENRAQFRQRGTRALRYELRQKGIDNALIDELTAELDEEALAWEAVQAKLRSWQKLERRAFDQKLVGFLSRRGFNYGVARTVSDRAWETLHHEDTADESEDDWFEE